MNVSYLVWNHLISKHKKIQWELLNVENYYRNELLGGKYYKNLKVQNWPNFAIVNVITYKY